MTCDPTNPGQTHWDGCPCAVDRVREAALRWALDHPPPDGVRLAEWTPAASAEYQRCVEEWLADGMAALRDDVITP